MGAYPTAARRKSGIRTSATPGTRARRRILTSSNRFWHAARLPGAPSTVQHLLADLVRQGELLRIRRGLYWRGRKTPLGMAPPSPADLTAELAGARGVGPAGLSASNRLRLSTQVPKKTQVAVPRRAPTDSGAVTFVSRAARTGRFTAGLNEAEVALLETLDGWSSVIEVPLPDAWSQLQSVLHGSAIRPDRLARAARTEPGPVRARLSALLIDAGFPELAQSVPDADVRTVKAALNHSELVVST